MERCVADTKVLAERAVAELERAFALGVGQRGALHLAVSGGSVAKYLFPGFVNAKVDWSKVHVWWVDERYVPADHPDSNYRVANELWLSKVKTNVHPMNTSGPFGEAANAYETEINQHLPSGIFDVAILGVGADGHIASLFPGHAAVNEQVAKVVAVSDSPKPPPQRLTLTVPVLVAARDIWVFATGAEKTAALHEAVMRQRSQLALARIMRDALHVRLWVDGGAAG